jgi:hypothetical protein
MKGGVVFPKGLEIVKAERVQEDSDLIHRRCKLVDT